MRSVIFRWLLILLLAARKSPEAEDYITADLSGTLPIILSAPHGGSIITFTPEVPDREDGCYVDGVCLFEHNCGTQDSTRCGVATLKDYKSDNLAELLRTELYNLKEEYPKIVLSNVHRKKLDPNRAVDEATFGQLVPMMVYDWYHGNISEAISVLGGTAGLQLDIHGYSNDNSIDWTELGYLMSRTRLNSLDDSGIDLLVNDSSIKLLAASRSPSKTFSQLLRGNISLGAYMEKKNLDAVPSPNNTGLGSDQNYFSGGYTTKTYRDRIDVIQIEVHYYHRSSLAKRQNYAVKLAQAIVEFFDENYEITCTTSSTSSSTTTNSNSNTVTISSKPCVVGLSMAYFILQFVSTTL